MSKRVVSAANFVATVEANVNNEELSDLAFREFIRTTLPIVVFEGADEEDVKVCKSCGTTVYAYKEMCDNCGSRKFKQEE